MVVMIDKAKLAGRGERVVEGRKTEGLVSSEVSWEFRVTYFG